MQDRVWPLELITDEEVKALVRACSSRAPTGLRNRAAIVLMARAGLRVGELLSLRPRDIDPVWGTVTVHKGKTGRRTVGLDGGSMEVVLRWIDRRAALGIDGRKPLICTLAGDPVYASYLRTMLARKARQAGIERRVWLHGLRHHFAVSLVREGHSMRVVQLALGHRSLSSTAVYLETLGAQEAVDALRDREWSLSDSRKSSDPAATVSGGPGANRAPEDLSPNSQERSEMRTTPRREETQWAG